MTPATLSLIVQGVAAGVAAAPQVKAVAQKGKEFLTELFRADAITVEQQNASHAHIDAIMAATLAGEEPPHWLVEPDPTDAKTPPPS